MKPPLSRGAGVHLPAGATLECFAENLRRLRVRRGLHQADLAADADLCARSISLLETAKVCPTPVTVWKLAHALSTTPAHLWGLKDC